MKRPPGRTQHPRRGPQHSLGEPSVKLIMAEPLLGALPKVLKAEITKRHEGIVYLLGTTDGLVTVALSASHPKAITTRGSFEVHSTELAKVVRAAADRHLQVVGQIHTHPRLAFHSAGDVAGARIRYPGYVSIVVPDYGVRLPRLDGSVFYMCDPERGFCVIGSDQVQIVPVIVA